LADKLYIFKSHDAGIVEQLKDCMAPRDLELKKGAQVMLIKNLSNSLVNGSIGIVEDFTAHEKTDAPSVEITGSYAMPIVRFSNGESVIINRHVWETTNLGIWGGEWNIFCVLI
jgi:hypothetical protein